MLVLDWSDHWGVLRFAIYEFSTHDIRRTRFVWDKYRRQEFATETMEYPEAEALLDQLRHHVGSGDREIHPRHSRPVTALLLDGNWHIRPTGDQIDLTGLARIATRDGFWRDHIDVLLAASLLGRRDLVDWAFFQILIIDELFDYVRMPSEP